MSNHIRKAVIVVAAVQIFWAASAGARDADTPLPPLSPQGEKVVANDKKLTEECLASVPVQLGFLVGTTLTTQSEKWGVVWRADFDVPPAMRKNGVNRIICRREGKDGRVAIDFFMGQAGGPLPSKDSLAPGTIVKDRPS